MKKLAIIGGGPAGYVAAERAGAKGLDVVLFEKHQLGGVCLNEGCIPTKTLLYGAKVYETAANAGKYGVGAGEVSFDYARMIDRKNKVVRKLVAGIRAKMTANNVEVVAGEAVITGRSQSGIEIECNGEKYMAENLLICSGSETVIPPIEGIAEAHDVIVTNRELLTSKERPASLVVIGGGVIGMEFASFFNTLGTEVVIVEMMSEILPGFDAGVSAMLRETYARKGIKFNLGCRVTRIERGENGGEVFYTDAQGTQHSVHGDKILLSVGRKPYTKGLGLETIGVATERGAIKVDERMSTNIPGVFAAGDVTGSSMFAHTAYREAEVVVNNLTGRDDTMSYKAVPSVVYTNPEVASVGLTAEVAAQKGIAASELSLPMAYAGRFVAENEGGNGLCKVVVGQSDGKVLGVHMIGNPSSEIVWGVCLAIERGMTVEEMESVIFPHPTVSEIIKEVVFAEQGK